MQTAGQPCRGCGVKIFLAEEGTWCPRCRATLHRACVREGDPCPGCGGVLEDPSRYFHRSERCPECGRPNSPVQDRCRQCEAYCVWDTKEEYLERKARLRQTGTGGVVLGLGVVIFGLACLGGGFVLIVNMGGLMAMLVLLLGMYAVPDGIVRVIRGLRALAFR